MDWGREWLVDFNVRKTQLVLFDWSNCSYKVGDYNTLYHQNCLLTLTNHDNQNYMI